MMLFKIKKILYILIFALFFLGCSTTKKPFVEYRIDTQPISSHLQMEGCIDKSIKIEQVFSDSSLISRDINYVIDNYNQYSYSQSRWATSPSSMISAEIVKMFKNASLFKTVQNYKTRSINDLVLETSVEDFMQYFEENSSKSYVNVSLSFSILDSKTNRVLASKNIDAKIDANTLDAKGGVKAFSKALKIVLNDAQFWLQEVCK